MHECFLSAALRRLVKQSHDAENVEGLRQRERLLATVKANNCRNTDACERGMFALRKLLRLTAADGFRDQCRSN